VRTAAGLARFDRLGDERSEAAVSETMIEEAGVNGLPIVELVRRAGVPSHHHSELLAALNGRAIQIGTVLVSAPRLAAAEAAMLGAIGQHHSDHPIAGGMPREELRARVFGKAPAAVFEYALQRLVDRGAVVARERIALAGHGTALSAEESRAREAIVEALRDSGLTPPDPGSLASQIAVSRQVVDRIANLLVRQQEVVKVGELLYAASALSRLKTDIRALKQTGATTLDVAAFKERYQLSRKYAIPLLEFLDRERVTRRVGEVRTIL
jgi:selenocysteine-specific elongation factor